MRSRGWQEIENHAKQEKSEKISCGLSLGLRLRLGVERKVDVRIYEIGELRKEKIRGEKRAESGEKREGRCREMRSEKREVRSEGERKEKGKGRSES
jgi:hypothetical protein